MNTSIYKATPIILLAGMIVSCKKSTLITYNAPDDIYFDYRRGVDPSQGSKGFPEDTLDFSFAFSAPELKESVFPLPLLVAGKPADHDRTINLTVDPSSTAVKDKHFVFPASIVMRAGRVADTIYIRLLRDASLKTDDVSLLLHLTPNENFGNDMKYKYRDVSPTVRDTIQLTTFRLKISDRLLPGPWWDMFFIEYFGPYSEKKARLMNQVTGMPLSFISVTKVDGDIYNITPYYGTLMNRYLLEQAASGNTIYESDGVTPMEMGPLIQ